MPGQNRSNAKVRRDKEGIEPPREKEAKTLIIYMRVKRTVIIHGGGKLLEIGDIDERGKWGRWIKGRMQRMCLLVLVRKMLECERLMNDEMRQA